jgi:NADH-quinone oxidoreductase subunit J
MAEVLFFIVATVAIAGAIGVVALSNPFYSVLALVVHLFSLAGLFLLLRAEFVAFAQIIVYAGAVMVLYVFVVAYVGGQEEPLGGATGGGGKLLAGLFAGALLIELCIAVLGSGLDALGSEGAGYDPNAESPFGSPSQIGQLLLTKFLFAFEAASILLLVAAVGAVVLARRRGGVRSMEPDDRVSVADLLRPEGTGTMAEAASGITGTPQRVLPGGGPDRESETSGAGW